MQLAHAYRSMACLSLSSLHAYLKDYPIKIDHKSQFEQMDFLQTNPPQKNK